MVETRRLVNGLWREALDLVAVADPASRASHVEGKLLRPALCLMAAGALGESDTLRYVRLAAAYELTHMASLAHDDVVDHAPIRRGQRSLNILWNDHAAVLGGDYLVARALELLVDYESTPLVASVLRAMRRMAEGELRFFGKNAETASAADCIALAEYKTASLFAAACSGPALLCKPDKAQSLHDFGIALGIAFQLVDDLLDITQASETLGKPACGDVVEGKHTLPLFLLRQALSPAARVRLADLRGTELTEDDVAWIRGATLEAGIDRAVLHQVEAHIERGLGHLATLGPSACYDSMAALARFVPRRHA